MTPTAPAPSPPEATAPTAGAQPLEPVSPAPVAPSPDGATVSPAPAPTPGAASPAPATTADAAIAPTALAEPEPEITGASLHWTVSPADPGSSFELQYRTRTGTVLAGETYWSEWSAWSATATIADCTADCSTSGDRDADLGHFQVTQIGAHPVALNTTTAEQEYRVRSAAAPTGRFWTDTSWRTASFSGGAANLGTFTTTANAALACTAGSFYSLAANGVITLVTPTGGGAATTAAFGAPPNFGNAEANALGIGLGGTSMYLLERPSSSATGISAIHHYSVGGGWQRLTLPSLEAARYTAGAVNLADGSYYFAAFANGQSQSVTIYRFTPATGVVRVGQFATQEVTQQASGDVAFDAAGNLFVAVTSAASGNPTRVYAISAASLAQANGTSLAIASATEVVTGFSEVVGAAFNSDGRLYLGSSTTVRVFNPATQAFEAGSAATGLSSTDLASCLTPSTLTVSKDVVGRAAPSDQFTISVRNASGVTLDSASTTGTGTGIQATAGPIAAVAGAAYTFTEIFSAGNGAQYATSFSCVDQDGSAVAVDTASVPGSARVAIPGAGFNVSCTIRNAPLTGAVTIRKVVEDAAGTVRSPGVGWSMSASVAATAGSVTRSGANTQSTGADGATAWGLTFDSTAARATVSVAETQREGYAFQEGACVVRPIASAPYVRSFTAASGSSLEGVAPGTRIECTFVNREQPTRLALVNQVTGGAAVDAWSLSATPTGGAPLAFESGVMQDVAPGAYALAATGGPAQYEVGPWGCLDQRGESVAVTDATITVSLGAQVTCTITHATAHLVLLKHIHETMAGTLEPEHFDLTASPLDAALGLAPTTVEGAELASTANTFEVRPGAGYALTESSTYAYLHLQLQRLGPDGWVDVASEIVAPAAGQTATYRFVNAAPPALALPLTGGLGADAYLVAGLALLALATAAGGVRMRRGWRARRLA